MTFRFEYPWVFALVLLLPLWIWVSSSPRFKTYLHFPSGAQLKTLPSSWARTLAPLPGIFSILGVLLLIVALARPQTGLREKTITSETVDIILAIDTSTSMQVFDAVNGRPSERDRLDTVKEVAKTFIDARKNDRIGLIAFAAMPYTESPLTLDQEWIQKKLLGFQSGSLPDGTAVGSALASAVNRLKDSEAESKLVVLLTDGINNRGSIEPVQAAQLAQSLNIKVYTIGAGSSGIVFRPIRSFGKTRLIQDRTPIDTEALEKIAEITQGKFFRAQDAARLKEVFEEINELERTEIELTEYTLYTEHFFWVLVAGLGCILFAEIVSSSRLGRVLA